MRRSFDRNRWTWPRLMLLAAVFFYLGLILVLPLAALGLELARLDIGAAFRELGEFDALWSLHLSVTLALLAVVVNSGVGVAGAIVLVRHRFFGRRLLDALIDLPLAVSPVMVGLAFLLLFGRNGWLEPWLATLGLKVTFSFAGLLVATLFVTFPFTLREVAYVLDELGTAEEESAATLGAAPWQTFWRVTLPNIRYGLGYGVVLTLARGLGEFGAVLVLGGAISGRTQTATTYVYAAMEERQDAAAYTMAMILATASVLLLMVLEWMKRRRHGER